MRRRISIKHLLTTVLIATMVLTTVVPRAQFVFAEENEEVAQEIEIQTESCEESVSQETDAAEATPTEENNLIVEEVPALEENPIPSVEEIPMPTVEENPTPSVEEIPMPTVEENPTPTVEEILTPSVEEIPLPTIEDILMQVEEEIPIPEIPKANYSVCWVDAFGNSIRNSETRTANVGDCVKIQDSDKYVDGYTFDSENPFNILEIVVSSENSAQLILWFNVAQAEVPTIEEIPEVNEETPEEEKEVPEVNEETPEEEKEVPEVNEETSEEGEEVHKEEEETPEEEKEVPEVNEETPEEEEEVPKEEEQISEEEEEVPEEEEEEIQMPEFSASETTSRGINVCVEAQEGIFPEGTTLKVRDVSVTRAINAAEEAIGEDEEVVDAMGVDITFYNSDKEKIEPENEQNVQVSISLPEALEGDDFTLIHQTSDGNDQISADVSSTGADFSSGEFSLYVIAGTSKTYASTAQESYVMDVNDSLQLYCSEFRYRGHNGVFLGGTWHIQNGSDLITINDGTEDVYTPEGQEKTSITVKSGANPGQATIKWNNGGVINYFYITIEDLEDYTFSFDLCGGQSDHTIDDIVLAPEELPDIITLPDGTGISYEGYEFKGWCTKTNLSYQVNGNAIDGVIFAPGSNIELTKEYSKKTTFYAVWAQIEGSKISNLHVSIRRDGVKPAEPSTYPSSEYYSLGDRNNINILEYINPLITTAGTENVNEVLTPKFYSEFDVFNSSVAAEHGWTEETHYVEWYVAKYQGDAKSGKWHVNGVIRSKVNVNLDYDPNCVDYSGMYPHGKQYPANTTTTVEGPLTMERTGYLFKGWNTKKDGSGNHYDEGDSIYLGEEDVTLYAEWQIKLYDVKYSAENGSVDTAINEKIHIDTTNGVTGSTASSSLGYTFDGWYKGENRISTSETLTSDIAMANLNKDGIYYANTEYVAKYIQDNYTVIYAPGEQGTWNAADETTENLHYGDPTPTPNVDVNTAHNPGYAFVKWDIEPTPTVTGNVTYTALWQELTQATVKKVWNDANDQDRKRPESLTMTLSNGTEVTLNKENNWEATVTELPKYNDNELIEYTWTEGAIPEGYSQTGNTTEGTVTTITNTYIPETTEVKVTKIWEDGNNQDRIRPEAITVNLLADGKKIDSKTVTESEGWKYSFTNLPKKNEGKDIAYTVTEEPIESYEIIIDGFTITNKYSPEITFVSGSKTWNDSNDQDGLRPKSITVNLLADGKKVDSKTVTESDDWKYSFINLPKKNEGKDIVYTVTEEEVTGYETTISDYDITNTHVPKTINVEGIKKWDDVDNKDGIRPGSITVRLLANGKEVKKAKVTKNDNWKYSFKNLPKYEEGKEITYTIKEDSVEGYTTTIKGSAKDGFIITNKHEPKSPAPTPTPTPKPTDKPCPKPTEKPKPTVTPSSPTPIVPQGNQVATVIKETVTPVIEKVTNTVTEMIPKTGEGRQMLISIIVFLLALIGTIIIIIIKKKKH